MRTIALMGIRFQTTHPADMIQMITPAAVRTSVTSPDVVRHIYPIIPITLL